ncbi:hypothetical protein LguiB_027181 [Lonicera macranthoides]
MDLAGERRSSEDEEDTEKMAGEQLKSNKGKKDHSTGSINVNGEDKERLSGLMIDNEAQINKQVVEKAAPKTLLCYCRRDKGDGKQERRVGKNLRVNPIHNEQIEGDGDDEIKCGDPKIHSEYDSEEISEFEDDSFNLGYNEEGIDEEVERVLQTADECDTEILEHENFEKFETEGVGMFLEDEFNVDIRGAQEINEGELEDSDRDLASTLCFKFLYSRFVLFNAVIAPFLSFCYVSS